MLPTSAGGDEWVKSGKELQKEGQAEVDAAKAVAAGEATVDSAEGKIKS